MNYNNKSPLPWDRLSHPLPPPSNSTSKLNRNPVPELENRRYDNAVSVKSRISMERPNLDSGQLARYIEETDGISKPWLLVQLRLAKLSEKKSSMSPADYANDLADIHQDLMKIGQWWLGREDEAFKP